MIIGACTGRWERAGSRLRPLVGQGVDLLEPLRHLEVSTIYIHNFVIQTSFLDNFERSDGSKATSVCSMTAERARI